jgi:hypothetical protein
MTISKLRNQGELLIDHSNSPGISEEWVKANQHHLAAAGATAIIVGKGKKFESGLKNCSHCGADVVMNPQRTREREWCWTCDAYICDGCGFAKKQPGYVHKSAREALDQHFNKFMRSF